MLIDMDCPFCMPAIEPQIVLQDTQCYAIWTQEVPLGSAMVLPRQHRATVFDLTEQEWRSTRILLREMRDLVAAAHQPDGWSVGWNLVPRYRDEPLAGRGIRAWIKDPDNRPPAHPPPPRPAWLG
jgi:diadenosine tetraphosphate (Ap4A) HIT family hydrolase